MTKVEEREWVVLENEGEKLFGVIHRPLEKKEGPGVLICHGFGGSKVGRFRLYVNLAQELASKGVTVLRVDFRGAGDSEGRLEDTTVAAQIEDALVAFEFLKSDASVDSERIGVLGASLGGAVAINAASRFQNAQSMVLWAPLFCPQKWLASWAKKQSNFSLSEPPVVEGNRVSPEFVQGFLQLGVEEALGTLSHVPLLHIHGTQDELVLIDHAEDYERVRVDAGVESEFIRLPEADHIFSRPEDRDELLRLTADWFIKTL